MRIVTCRVPDESLTGELVMLDLTYCGSYTRVLDTQSINHNNSWPFMVWFLLYEPDRTSMLVC